jgi:tyrosyl-tRNA synthetase
LTPQQVGDNAATYLAQVKKVLLEENLEVRDNAEWLAGMSMEGVLGLMAQMTVARMLERQDFSERYGQGRPIAVSEFLYPLLQGQDSVALEADVELGGTDQTFNLLVGRDLQGAAGQEPQSVLTMPLIEGLDGAAKMSKTAGNTIGVDESPQEMFGKAMSLRDELMVKYFRLVTDLHPDEVDQLDKNLATGALHPGDTKRRLAREIVSLYHSAEAADQAERQFDVQFKDKGIPDDVAEFPVGTAQAWFLPALLAETKLVNSGGEGRRMVGQGAVRLDGEPLTDPVAELPSEALIGRVLQVGKRRFVRLVQ